MRRLSLLLAICALVPSSASANHGGIAASCEGNGPTGLTCERKFTAAFQVAGMSVTRGWSLGVLRATLSDGEKTQVITCYDIGGLGGCAYQLPPGSFQAGTPLTFHVDAVGDGAWRVEVRYV